jgi:Tol biopolymer transport system component
LARTDRRGTILGPETGDSEKRFDSSAWGPSVPVPTGNIATGPIDMGISELRTLCVAVMVCVLRPGDLETLVCQFASLDAARAEPTAVGRQAGEEPDRPVPERFMVIDRGCALLGPDGEERERLESITNGAGAISPDGRWAAFSKSEPNAPPGKRHGRFVIQSHIHPEDFRIVPLVWGTTGSSLLPIWSSDSKRILICEQGFNQDGSQGSAYRVYDLPTKNLTEFRLSDECWPSDWSADGKRVLATLRSGDIVRVGWVSVDSTGKPEFITSEQEVAYGAKLSPDGRRILCMVGSRTPGDEASRSRLYVIDLATKKRVIIDKRGYTHGYCWSSDGLKIAYTWQMPIRQPDEAVERKTYLITCDPDGSNRKIITMRKYDVPRNSSGRDGVIISFQVLSWWR